MRPTGVIQGSFRGGRAPVIQARAVPASIQPKTPPVSSGPRVIAPPPIWFPNQKPAQAQAKPGARSGRLPPPPPPKPALQAKPTPESAVPGVLQLRGGGEAFAVPSTLNLSGSGGQPLPAPVREKMESFFRTSFADVRVHVGNQAPAIGALAFTHGSNLYFAPGQYNPHTTHGQQLLGHELTHVVQQRAGRVKNPFGSGVAVVQDHGLEAEADQLGKRAAADRIAEPPTGKNTAQAFARRGAIKPSYPAEVAPGILPLSRVVQRKGGTSEFDNNLTVAGNQAVVTQMAYGGGWNHSVLFLEYIDPSTGDDVLEMVHLKTLHSNRIETKPYNTYHEGKHISKHGGSRSYQVTLTEINLIKTEAQQMDQYWSKGWLQYASIKGSVTSSWRKASAHNKEDMTCKDVTDAFLIAAGLRQPSTSFFRHFWNPPSDM
jgi:hypothetical protein